MAKLINPVLRGFNPDPSIVRVGSDYYLATSTMEWWPAVRLHHSTDLVHWRVIGHALTDPERLDLRGIPASGGIWAPSLSFSDGQFWLIYTVVRTMDAPAKDLTNYLVTAPAIDGPWSDPIELNTRGFDASLFHDEDGRKYLVGVQWDPRPGRHAFAGICLTEYSHAQRALTGPTRTIFTRPGLIEGPNLYRIDDRYLLLLAQGGTGFEHGISAARAESLSGVFEPDPQYSVLTSRDDPSLELQKAGHGELVQTPSGDWYLAHLASRVVTRDGERFSVVGRETCLQRVTISDGWIRLADDDGRPVIGTRARVAVVSTAASADGGDDTPGSTPDLIDDFDSPVLDDAVWSALRRPADPDWATLTARPGWLRLNGRQSTASLFELSLLGTRICEPDAMISTIVDADPRTVRHQAGIAAWYDRLGYHWLFVGRDDDGERFAAVESGTGHRIRWSEPVSLPSAGAVTLRITLAQDILSFAVEADGQARPVGQPQDSITVSDDYPGPLRFSGCVAALVVHDHDGDGFHADFDRFNLTYFDGR